MATDAKVHDVEALLRESEWLREFARALVRDEHSADDLVQETWLAALRGAPGETRNHRGWLTTVVQRLATKARRAQRAREGREHKAARDEAQPATIDVVERVTLHRAVVDAVLALDEPYRATVLLRWFEGLPPRAIAQREGVPVNTVRARLQRGLALLRRRLDVAHGSRAAWALPLCAELPRAAVWIQVSSIGAMLMTLSQKVAVAVIVAALISAWLLFSMSPSSAVADPIAHDALDAPVAIARSDNEPSMTPQPQHDATAPVVPRRELALTTPIVDGAVVDGLVVTGELIDERTLTPIAAAKIIGVHRFARSNDEVSTTSGRTGTFKLVVRPGAASALLIESTDHAPLFVRIPYAVPVAPDDQAPVDLGRIRVPRGTRVAGRVFLETNGAAVRGARLLWAEVHAARHGSPLPLARPFATTREDGTFVATERVPPAVDPEKIVVFAFADEGIGWVEFAVAPDTERIDVLEIPIHPSGALRVRVHDSLGLPISDARVRLVPMHSPFVRLESDVRALETLFLGRHPAIVDRLIARTDETGVAERRALPPGRYFVSVHRSGHRPVHRYSVDVVAGRVEDVVVELLAITDVFVAVRVLDLDGRAIQDARVKLAGAEEVARTDADGRCCVGPTRVGGRAALNVDADGYADLTQSIDIAALAATPAAAEPITIRLVKLAPIAGIVVDTTGAPVAGIDVQSQSVYTSKATTDASGAFRLMVAAGSRHGLVVRSPDRTWTTEHVSGVHAGDEHVRLVVERTARGFARLHAEIVASDGVTPAEFVRATLFPEPDRHDLRMRTYYTQPVVIGPHHVAASELAPGRYALTVTSRLGGTSVCSFEVLPGEVDVRLRVVVGPPALIAGWLRLDSIPPELRTGALHVISDQDGYQVDAVGTRTEPAFFRGASVRADGDGRFWIGGTPAGKPVQLRLHHPSFVANAVVVPQPGRPTPVELVVTIGGTVRFASDTSLPPGRYRLFAGGSTDAMHYVEFVDTDEPRVIDAVTTVAAGPLHWRLVGVTNAAPGVPSRSIDVRGSDVVAAGRTARIVIDVLR